MADSYELRADQLERAFVQMGLTVRRESSRVSRSEYVEVESPEYTATDGERGETLKFRVSDHELPRGYQQPDFDVIADGKEHGGAMWNKSGTWYQAVEWAGSRFGIEPKGNAKMLLAKETLQREQARQAALEQQEVWKASADALAQERGAWLRTLPIGATVRASRRLRLVAEQGGAIISSGPNAAGWMGMSNAAIACGMSKPIPLVEALAYMGIAPAPCSGELGSQALDQSRMQERPAVRAGESGSLEEPAQLGGGAGSNPDTTALGVDAQLPIMRTLGGGSLVLACIESPVTGGDPAAGLAAFMAANEREYTPVPLDTTRGGYSGPIVFANEHYAVQLIGRGSVAIHDVRAWEMKPTTEHGGSVNYRNGVPSLKLTIPGLDRHQSSGMSLG